MRAKPERVRCGGRLNGGWKKPRECNDCKYFNAPAGPRGSISRWIRPPMEPAVPCPDKKVK